MWNISSCSAPLATFALSLVKRHPPLPSLNITQPAHFVNTYVFTNIPNMSIISTHEAHVSNAWRCRRFSLLLFNVGFHFHCLRASFFSVPPPLPVHCEVFSQSPHSNNNNSNNYATWLAHTRNSCCARSSSFLVLSTSKWSCKLQRSSLSCLPLPSSCPANPVAVTVSLSPTFPFPFADPETQTSVGLAAINRLSRQLKTL